MIRVTIRHEVDNDSVLVGDFAPDQIEHLLAVVRATPLLLWSNDDSVTDFDIEPQFVVTEGVSTSKRFALELIITEGE